MASTENFTALVDAAEKMLSAQFGTSIRLTDAVQLTEDGWRNLVVRCRVTGAPSGQPNSIILKQAVTEHYEPSNRDSWDTQRFFKDWYGAQFLSQLGVENVHSPRFYGGDVAQGFFLLEDLGEHMSLVEPLMGDDATVAEEALLAFASRLGAMHADTIGMAEQFERLSYQVNPDHVVNVAQACAHQANVFQQQTDKLLDFCIGIGMVLPSGLAEDFRAIHDTIAQPDAFLAYVHGDPCPDNVFYSRPDAFLADQFGVSWADNALSRYGVLRVIDFEFGRYGHALRDAAYGRMSFPTCWSANQIPGPIVQEMEQHYRQQLSRTCPAALDDQRFEREMLLMCGYWLLETLATLFEDATPEDHDWGIASLRSRIVARLQAFLTYADKGSQLPALSQFSRDLLGIVRRRWPETPALSAYPAFAKYMV